MPLLSDTFDEANCDAFIADKETLWSPYGYGPWAFIVDGNFVGWGGLQPENGDADIALVLHPKSWGMGKPIYDEIIKRAFGAMGLESVTALLPLTRRHVKGLQRLGFEREGDVEYLGERFIRYRLHAPSKSMRRRGAGRNRPHLVSG
ncbi:MAG: N-acetyltransferase, partial [Candidatus Poribacteria bacterium]|nr:N-acetyltransferase [Candidatus Poribacteria bacterium]